MTDNKHKKRQFIMLPVRAAKDKNMTDSALSVLVLLCSYCDKDGITWVSQNTLAEDLDITRPAVTKQISKLRKLGYVQTIKKGHRNVHSNTLQIIFDTQEQTQPNVGQLEVARVDQDAHSKMMAMINKAFNRPTQLHIVQTTRSESPTVKAMKEQIKMKQKGSS
jgi:biotin operon repressor